MLHLLFFWFLMTWHDDESNCVVHFLTFYLDFMVCEFVVYDNVMCMLSFAFIWLFMHHLFSRLFIIEFLFGYLPSTCISCFFVAHILLFLPFISFMLWDWLPWQEEFILNSVLFSVSESMVPFYSWLDFHSIWQQMGDEFTCLEIMIQFQWKFERRESGRWNKSEIEIIPSLYLSFKWKTEVHPWMFMTCKHREGYSIASPSSCIPWSV